MTDDEFTPLERRNLGCARAQHAVFDAVMELWEVRQQQGLTQAEIAEFLGRDPGWVSRTLSGPGNWTLKTLGEFIEALNGLIEIKLLRREALHPGNFNIYSATIDEHAQKHCPIVTFNAVRPNTTTSTSRSTVQANVSTNSSTRMPSTSDVIKQDHSLLSVSM